MQTNTIIYKATLISSIQATLKQMCKDFNFNTYVVKSIPELERLREKILIEYNEYIRINGSVKLKR